ncbi:MAG: T9SS type A sorting domain-containing protein [Bacteroidia bacterium]|nr:T9SS type A sorting domain-containing protein [Bacteroidia bacterium]
MWFSVDVATNSVFRPCEINGTWKGLTFVGVGEFDNIINTSTFKNAEVALYFEKQADAVISDNLFSNCNYGIRVEGINNFNHPISGNRFVTDDFFPDFNCATKYNFITNLSTYGIYSTASKFLEQVSQNQFISSKATADPKTYGIYQNSGGGGYSENTFTDLYSSIWLESQLYYSYVENNIIESDVVPAGSYPAIYVGTSTVPIIEINNNDISNNYNKIVNHSAIYTSSSANVSIVNNNIEGFNYGIVAFNGKNHQISNNQVKYTTTYGIYIQEQNRSKSYVTCNSVKMLNYTSGTGFLGINMSATSEVSSNCITDCYISMNFTKLSGAPVFLPKIRNNYLYNYTYVGINVDGCIGNIGTSTDPGMNTLYSNKNSAVDINSTLAITAAGNYGMNNVSFPMVQLVAGTSYFSTASCGQENFSTPTQGNLNVNYTCNNFSKLTMPLKSTTGTFSLVDNYLDTLMNSTTQFNEAGMILACYDQSDIALLNEIISSTLLSANEKALLRFGFYFRNSDVHDARINMNLFSPGNSDEADFKTLMLYMLDIADNGWSILSDNAVETLQMIKDKESVNSNIAIAMLNNTSTYRDFIIFEPISTDVLVTDNIKNTGKGESYLNIYPNPASDKVFIELISKTENSKIQIFDARGELVTEYSLNIMAGVIEMDVHSLHDGIYFITLTDPDSGFVQKGKIVKMN